MGSRNKKGAASGAGARRECASQEPSIVVEHPDCRSGLGEEGSEKRSGYGDTVTSKAGINSSSKKKKPPTVTQTTVTQTTPLSPSNKSSLEDELEWCIAQLELGMLRTGATKSQKQQNGRSLSTLRGTKTPLPKKRQLMRSLFGDYRSKMKTQPIPESVVTKEVSLEAAKPEAIQTLGTYYRQSTPQTGKGAHVQGDEDFRFNFVVDD